MTRSTAADGAELANWADPDPDHVLTWRQQKILQVITDFAQRRRYAPTLREIGTAAGLSSTSSVSYQLAVLQGKGYLRRDARRPRTVEVRLPGREAIRLEVEDLADAVDIPSRDGMPTFPFPWSARSPPVFATWPIRSSRTPSCCPGSSSATGHSSCCGFTENP